MERYEHTPLTQQLTATLAQRLTTSITEHLTQHLTTLHGKLTAGFQNNGGGGGGGGGGNNTAEVIARVLQALPNNALNNSNTNTLASTLMIIQALSGK